jgi:hypothetical protein
MRRWLRMPSPSMVVALTALFFAVSGSAYGLVITGRSIKNNSVRTQDIRNGTLRSKDVKRDSIGGDAINEGRLGSVPMSEGSARQAVVTAEGILARGRGVTSAARTAEGRYQVIFNRDVRACVYVASLGDPGAAAPPQGQVSTTSLASNVAGIVVRTEASNGAVADRPFHLVISC